MSTPSRAGHASGRWAFKRPRPEAAPRTATRPPCRTGMTSSDLQVWAFSLSASARSIVLADCLHGCSLELVEGNLCLGFARPSESGTELACSSDRPTLARTLQERLVKRPCLVLR